MRCLSSAAVCLCLAAAAAAESPQRHALTPKEAAEGWLLLFDGESTFGWNVEGQAKVKDGLLTVGGEKAARLATTLRVWPFELYMECRWKGSARPQLRALHCDACAAAWAPDRWISFVQSYSEQKEELALQSEGRVVAVSTNEPGERVARPNIDFRVPEGTVLELRNVKLRPRGLRPLFNGKDLTGWKEFPGRKSKFSVTPEGTLRVQDGPGDLQTEGQWADFVLQLECRTNGDRLNSGVFFRCRPGEYQQGYEAQIHNGFAEQPGKEYKVERFDPKTHEPAGVEVVKSAALDYGTGAIYRRVPARRQAARDREWFTLTVVADGRHLATWVNGVQTAAWTDGRPLKDNARQGCYLKKGPISLQGHDPTTDLSFRNFRLAELPTAKQ